MRTVEAALNTFGELKPGEVFRVALHFSQELEKCEIQNPEPDDDPEDWYTFMKLHETPYKGVKYNAVVIEARFPASLPPQARFFWIDDTFPVIQLHVVDEPVF